VFYKLKLIITPTTRMGVQRLQTYIQKNHLGKNIILNKESTDSSIKKIIVDGDSVAFYLYESSKLPRLYGGEYNSLAMYMRTFFSSLVKAGLELFVIFDGIPPVEKRATIQERRKSKCNSGVNLWNQITEQTEIENINVPITRPGLVRNVMTQVLTECGIKMRHSVAENDDYIVHLMQEGNYDAVLAKDTDFLIYNIKAYLPINHLTIVDGIINAKSISCNDICRHFRLQKKHLPLFSFLAGNDITHGSKLLTDTLRKIHQQARPCILKNVAKMITHHMDQIMQILLNHVAILEGLTQCYKKYECKSPSTFDLSGSLPKGYIKGFEAMEINTEVAILFMKNTRCFTASFSGLKSCIPVKLQPFRARFYGVLGLTDVAENMWSYDNKEPTWYKHYVESDTSYRNRDMSLSTFLSCYGLPNDYLKHISPKYYAVAIAAFLVATTMDVSLETLNALVYHVYNVGKINLGVCQNVLEDMTFTKLNNNSLEIMDCYLTCLQDIFFFNQCFFHPIQHTDISTMSQATLFYAFHNKLLNIPNTPEPIVEQIINGALKAIEHQKKVM
jgi:hypothetical protein